MSDYIIRVPLGATKKKVIVGRGYGGKSRRGNNGQNSRSGGGVRFGFEGGQTPLFRRLPRRGFSNEFFKQVYTLVNLDLLESLFSNGEEVNYDTLLTKGVIKRSENAIKILGNGKLTKKLTVQVSKISESAKAAVEAAGGTVTLLEQQKQ